MKVYNVGTGGLWIGILVFGLIILSMLSIGGFLLGTPIGWAILTLLVIRHFYRRYQRKKNYEAYSRAYETTEDNYSSTYGSASDFATAYRQEENDEKVFSNEDKSSAMDVEFKEV